MKEIPKNIIYEKYKFKKIKREGYSAKLVGFTESRFILATTEKVPNSFKKLDKETFISKKYRNESGKTISYYYIYCNELELIQNHPSIDRIKNYKQSNDVPRN